MVWWGGVGFTDYTDRRSVGGCRSTSEGGRRFGRFRRP